MSLTSDQLYALLPAVYRTRDAAVGGPLQAFATVLAEQLSLVDDATQQLYADQFIETCSTWAIPYLGDLIGVNPLYEVSGALYSSRAEVANTIGYRRRKGTLLALDQLAADVSGRGAMAIEQFRHLITTESMRLVRPHHASNVNLRYQEQLDPIDTAFDTTSRTIDVRRIAPRTIAAPTPDSTPLDIALHGGGRFNIPDLAVYLWRWRSNCLQDSPAVQIDARRFLFSPLGQNIPLFNQASDRQSFERLTTRYDVAQPIRRREFARHPSHFYSPDGTLAFTNDGMSITGRTSISLAFDGIAVPLAQICSQDLSDHPDGSWNCTPAGKIGIDPELGRIQLGSAIPVPNAVTTTFCYGTPALMGGGPYDRSASLVLSSPFNLDLVVVTADDLSAAIANWNALPAGSTGRLILASLQLTGVDLTGTNAIQLPFGSTLTLVSAKPALPVPILNESLAVLCGDLQINAPAISADEEAAPPMPGTLNLNGLWISGQVHVTGGPSTITLSDCTLVPGISLTRDGDPAFPEEPSIIVDSVSASLALERCITGPILIAEGSSARICCSIVDAGSPCAIAYAAPDHNSAGADLHIEDSTVIGKLHIHTLPLASNTIFHARLSRKDMWPAALWCASRQSGCVRFCWLPSPALTPRRYECLPPSSGQAPALAPRFITLRYGSPSYCLLSGETPLCIMKGASDGGEIGAYNSQQEWQAFRNVQIRVEEYLPFSLEAGIFLVPSEVDRAPRVNRFQYGKRKPLSPCDDGEEVWLAGIGVGLV